MESTQQLIKNRKGRFDKVNLKVVRGRTRQKQNINTSHVYIHQVETTQLNKKYGCISLMMSFGTFLTAFDLDLHY